MNWYANCKEQQADSSGCQQDYKKLRYVEVFDEALLVYLLNFLWCDVVRESHIT